MVIFISGSVNSGKSTTSKAVAEELQAVWLDVDEIAHSIPDFDLSKDIPRALELTIQKVNRLTRTGKTVVANYVLRQRDYEMLRDGLDDKAQYYFTLAPRLDVVRRDRGRGMNDWEYKRIKHHYDTGIASPRFGEIIDTSDMGLDEVTKHMITKIKQAKT